MYDPIDEKQAMEMAEEVTENVLIQPLEQRGVISQDCADRVKERIREAFRDIEAQEIPKGGVEEEEYWEALQKLWGFRQVPQNERVIPMNAANLCPAPTFLIEAMSELRAEYNLNVAQQKRMVNKWTGEPEESGEPGRRLREMRCARNMIAEGLRLDDSDDIAIVRNASEGNSLINCGYRNWHRADDLSERENIVIWSENHPTNKEAWWLRAQWDSDGGLSNRDKMLFDIRVVRFEEDASDQDIAASFVNKIDAKTRFVTFTETSNGNGFRIPESVVKRIWHHVQDHRYDCHVHIDATMTWGARPINLQHPYCHSMVSSAHKWFLGPKETGILYMSRDKVKNFMPSIFAYDEAITVPEPWDTMPDTAQRFAMLGQRDDINIINLALAQEFWTKLTPRKPYDRVAYLARSLKEKLKDDWDLVTPEDMSRSWGVVRISAPRENRPMNLYNWLYAGNNGYRIAGSGDEKTFRLCPHIYNTMADIDRAVEGMNAWRDTKS